MKVLKWFLFCFLISSCNSPRAVYDYDNQVQFSQYNSYNFYPEMESGLSGLDERRLFSSLENALREKDLVQTGTPQLFLNVKAEEFQEPSRNSLGVGIGGGGGNVGVGMSGGIPLGGPDRYIRLTFDLIDVNNDALVWQAVVDAPFDYNANPEKRQEQFDKIVKKALKAYPPRK
jgi:hypothetical protein